jgi:hypothetical protein
MKLSINFMDKEKITDTQYKEIINMLKRLNQEVRYVYKKFRYPVNQLLIDNLISQGYFVSYIDESDIDGYYELAIYLPPSSS